MLLWQSVKALEADNKRLKKELESWIEKTLTLSKRLYEYRQGMHRLPDTQDVGLLFEKQKGENGTSDNL